MKQISIFLQNTNGQLAELVELFSRNNINLRAMSLADTQKMVERLRYDLLYIDNMSLIMDMKIMVYTAKIIIQGRGK